jgi:hypothetical protein
MPVVDLRGSAHRLREGKILDLIDNVTAKFGKPWPGIGPSKPQK